MDEYQLDYTDVDEIFREKLKIQNIVKSVSAIFDNERYFRKINYKPYFQRNYVWDDEKATYFIESILLGTEIPPLVFFQTRTDNEVIDGRQRFETINRFLNDKLILKEKGLHSLKQLSGKKYSQIDNEIRQSFEDTRIRILQYEVVNEPRLDEQKEDKIKKEIFRRYNSGITPLQKYDIERAIFIDDPLTNEIIKKLNEDNELFSFLCSTILPRSKKKANKRDKVNILSAIIRELMSMKYLTIYEYAKSSKTDLIRRIYFDNISENDKSIELNRFLHNIKILKLFSTYIENNNVEIKSNQLFFECLYWIVNIASSNNIEILNEDIIKIMNLICINKSDEVWNKINNNPQRNFAELFEPTGSHYYGAIMNRYIFMSKIFEIHYGVDFSRYIKTKTETGEHLTPKEEFSKYRINKALPETLTIVDILRDIDKSRFLIRPNYQRSEVKNISKSSYLMESILLGIKIPPLFIYKRSTGIKEVVDGQQRLLTILGFLGKNYIDEDGKSQYSVKNRFKLSQLKIMKELKGDTIDDLSEFFESKILDFEMDIVEIDGQVNPDFSPIDLFLRLNTKPYPIKDNTFEMWNAYLDKKIILRVKDLANDYNSVVFRAKDARMKVEELITSLAYIDYKMRTGAEINTILNIYCRDDRLCARLTSKAQMTKQLYEISVNSTDDFLSALDNVQKFAEKIMLLTDGNKEQMKELLNHSRKGTAFKTDQNFYYLWLVLRNIDILDIEKNKQSIFNIVKSKFKDIQSFKGKVDLASVSRLFDSYHSEI